MEDLRAFHALGSEVVSLDHLSELSFISTSKGNQRKWYDSQRNVFIKSQFYYQDRYWRDDLVEVIASTIGAQLKTSISITKYVSHRYKTGGLSFWGCESDNFCGSGETYVSFAKLLKLNGLTWEPTGNAGQNFDNIRDTMQFMTGIDAAEYLEVMALVDFLVGNEDRHLNNFGVINSEDGFRLAPIFDSGLGLFEHDGRYTGVPFRECLSLMRCQPFGIDNTEIITALRPGLERFLPGKIDLTGVQLPSVKAGSYLRNRCSFLGVDLIGVD